MHQVHVMPSLVQHVSHMYMCWVGPLHADRIRFRLRGVRLSWCAWAQDSSVSHAGWDHGQLSCCSTPAQVKSRCVSGVSVGYLASRYTTMTTDVLAPWCCVLSLHTTHHIIYITHLTYLMLTTFTVPL